MQDAVKDPSWISGDGAGLGGALGDYSVTVLGKTCNGERNSWERSSMKALGLPVLGEQPVFQAGM